MTCDSILKLIPLYYYGELTPDEEDRVEEHTHACLSCNADLTQQRTLAAALDRRQLLPRPMLLEDCRSDLMAAIQGGAPSPRRSITVNCCPVPCSWKIAAATSWPRSRAEPRAANRS